VRHRRVARHEQIEVHHNRRGIEKRIVAGIELIAEKLNCHFRRQVGELIEAMVRLKTDQPHALDSTQRGKFAKRD